MYSSSNERFSNLDKGVGRNDILGIYLSLFVFVMLFVKLSVYQRPTGSLAAIHISLSLFTVVRAPFPSSFSFRCLSRTSLRSFLLCEYLPEENLRRRLFLSALIRHGGLQRREIFEIATTESRETTVARHLLPSGRGWTGWTRNCFDSYFRPIKMSRKLNVNTLPYWLFPSSLILLRFYLVTRSFC